MISYSALSEYYDRLTVDVEYDKRADYINQLISHYNGKTKTVLDLACGTFSIGLRLIKMGYDVTGIDVSPDMLTLASEKAEKQNTNPLFLCQNLTELDLYGTSDCALCLLDSLNHLIREKDVKLFFERLNYFLNPNALFIFDLNTIYKHKYILANNSFVKEDEGIFCVWQSNLNEKTNEVTLDIDIFEKFDDGIYDRYSDTLKEKAYSTKKIEKLLNETGYSVLNIYDDMSFDEPKQDSERIYVIARKV